LGERLYFENTKSMLKKQITLYSLIMIAVGSSIGSGIFRAPAEIAGYLPTSGWMLGVWIAGGLIALCGALTFAELASIFPKAGGFYVFLKEAFGDWMSRVLRKFSAGSDQAKCI
jgi:APA family basic amino acid/polyamine antiporter